MRGAIGVAVVLGLLVACSPSSTGNGAADAGDDTCFEGCPAGEGIPYSCTYQTCYDNPCPQTSCVTCSDYFGPILMNGMCMSQGEIDCQNAGGTCFGIGSTCLTGNPDPSIDCMAGTDEPSEICCIPGYDAGMDASQSTDAAPDVAFDTGD